MLTVNSRSVAVDQSTGDTRSPPRSGRLLRFTGLGLTLAGIAATFWLFASNDLPGVVSVAAGIGWGVAGVVAFHLLPLGCDAVGWRVLFHAGKRPPMGAILRVRWLSESLNTLLPFAQVGGDVVRTLLVGDPRLWRGPPVALAEAAAIVTLDVTIGFAAVVAFCAGGLVATRTLSVSATLWVVGGLVAALATVIMLQRSAALSRVVQALAARVGGRLASSMAVATIAFDAHLADHWRKGAALAHSFAWRMASLLLGIGETWVILYWIGRPVGLRDAAVMEIIAVAARAAIFVVPGGLGVQEGALLAAGGLTGLAPEAALALAAVKRGREWATALPGFLVWLAMSASRARRGRGRTKPLGMLSGPRPGG